SGSSFAEEMRKAGLTPGTKLVQAETGRPPAAVAEQLELGDDEQVLIRKRHMFTDGAPTPPGRFRRSITNIRQDNRVPGRPPRLRLSGSRLAASRAALRAVARDRLRRPR